MKKRIEETGRMNGTQETKEMKIIRVKIVKINRYKMKEKVCKGLMKNGERSQHEDGINGRRERSKRKK